MSESLNENSPRSSKTVGVIIAARPGDVAPNEVVPADQVPADLIIPTGYVARRLLPFSKPPSIATRLIRWI
jgi:hypothetical protein